MRAGSRARPGPGGAVAGRPEASGPEDRGEGGEVEDPALGFPVRVIRREGSASAMALSSRVEAQDRATYDAAIA